MSVIFLAGVHGVGKGHIGAPLAPTLGLSHFTASQLIREERGQATWGTDKKTTELELNQSALIRAVNKRRQTTDGILVDGHFVLRDSCGALKPLEMMVFKDLNLSGVILLTEDSHVVSDRLKLRDQSAGDIGEIQELSEAEFASAKAVCSELSIPLVVIHKPTESSVKDAILQMLEIPARTFDQTR